ncbi:MAG: ornithine carbamoyltransferase [Desulfobacterales bacterium]|nr:ornithine carbamoyltransferase [Desulfobacterales bacterium]
MKKDILTLLDLEKSDFDHLFNITGELKDRDKKKITENCLTGKTLGLIFDKPSTRTRFSFEAAMIKLGGTPIYINAQDTQISRSEPPKDTARVLSRYLDILAIRTFEQSFIEEIASYASIPIINALTDAYHPCQILSDIFTIIEFKETYENLNIVWVGDGNNVAHSWVNAWAVLNFNLTIACPENYMPNPDIIKKACEIKGKQIKIINDPFEGVKEAQVIYTDAWASMGQEKDKAERKKAFQNFQINSKLLKNAPKDVVVMHCLPAYRGEEITEDVLEGNHSVVWDQAENKMHMHKAILKVLLGCA